jgi:phage protein D
MGLNILIAVDDIPNSQLTEQVTSVEVYEKIDENTHYKLNFMVDVCNDDIAESLQNDTSNGKILSVLVQTGNGLVCLVKGPVTQQEANLQHGGAGSWIHVEGEDTGYNMDHTTRFRVTPSGTDSDIATQIISSNENMIPDVESTPSSSHNEETHSHVQRESDLSLIRSLARRNGYHFWITYSDAGIATGHFRSRSLEGESTADLIVNLENYNIDALRVNADSRRPTETVGRQLDLRNKELIGESVSLNDPSLGTDGLPAAAGANAQSIHLAPTVDDAGAMQARSEGALRDAQWFINATCRTSLHRLCKLVRFHTLVTVHGAGSRHSGKYYVTGVKHIIDAASHVMELELARNAWGN